MKKTILVLLCLSLSIPCYARTITINADRSGEYPTIQAAIDDANDGDVIILEPGRYTGDGNRDIDYLGKAITVRSTDPNDTEIVAATIIDCNYEAAAFYFQNNEDADSVLSGFTITNGRSRRRRGGITCFNSSPTISNCIVTNSRGSHGIFCVYGSPKIINCTVINNDEWGIICLETDMALIAKCTIIGNNRGGIYCREGQLKITNCNISDNLGGIYGGIYCEDGDLIIQNCIINNNRGRGIWCEKVSSIIQNCIINNNSGGGIWCQRSYNHIIENCILIGNKAEDGAAIGFFGGFNYTNDNANINNCVISGNVSEKKGGAILASSLKFLGRININGCTITGNQASQGGGIFNNNTYSKITNCILWENKASNGGPQIYLSRPAPASRAQLNYTNIQNGQAGVYVGDYCDLEWGPGNVDDEPMFVDPGYWADPEDPNIIVEPNDPNAIWVEGDYHLLADSPCINTGDPCHPYDPNETDLDGNPRIIDSRIDMGAYEYLPPLEARLLIRPRTINRKSHQRHIMAWLSLPAGITKDDIDSNVPLTLYPGQIEASRQFIFESNRGGKTHAFILAFFNKRDLMNTIPDNGPVQLETVGQLVTGQYFFGQRTVRIINPPHRRRGRRPR